ncbi:unnamed protein product [Angiostrongylus costaricensis]|uniref:7TM_GPCR_Srx domain-containing protein n=1 Tax=Angiostrongylus costaricensis TaxID=334426 RepID=A0A158PHI8_ANGCS|nr:unnamed protein product [Angiostrongylus costaricensis]
MGTALVVLGVIRFVCYFLLITVILRMSRNRLLYFLGIICVISSRGSKLLRDLCFSLSAATLMPSLFYLWLDYRCFLVFIYLLLKLRAFAFCSETPMPLWTFLLDQRCLQNCLVIMAALFLILSCSTVSLDVYTIWKKLFYRLFHGAEQKTPFLTALTAIFAMAASTPRFTSIAFICLSLYSLNSTVFQMISYLYLSSNGYFGDHLCELFFPGVGRCHLSVTKSGSIHSVISRILLLGFFGGKCLGSVAFPVYQLFFQSTVEYDFVITVLLTKQSDLQLLYLQILCAENLTSKPMLQTTLLIMSVVRFVEILTQLDYRGTGDDLSVAWKVHQTADFFALISTFSIKTNFKTLVCNRINNKVFGFHQFLMGAAYIGFPSTIVDVFKCIF